MGHMRGGLAAGAAAVALGGVSGAISLDDSALRQMLYSPFASPDFYTLGGMFLTAVFMALFPDIDTPSIPQRWFLRAMAAVLVGLAWQGRMDLFAVVTLATLAPMLDHHRGWTHSLATPWVLSAVLAVVWEYFRAKEAWLSGFSWANVGRMLQDDWMYVVAAVMGHYTHLLLDLPALRFVPFLRNEPDHH
ncbi:MAG: metal-dependent hydrolase [Deltaproteobacteria bacterium]|nr:metal-dependent hydrolase [Deltaproteobacteria bacterium]MDH4122030.1 metal-dependent hydrolase [Deltaproteobacteria bacterium]